MKSGWQTSTLGDVLAVIRNGVNCKQDKSGNGDRISRIESISDATFDLEKVGYSELSERDREKYRLMPGDILFSHINSAVHVGKTAVFDCDEPVYHGVNLLLMRPKEVVTAAYLDHALKYIFQSGYWRSVCKQSVNQASVNQQDISRVEIRYPKSLAEQQRIVGLLDEAFEGLATAKANAEKNLQNARALFESHLQSVFTQRGPGWVEKRLGDVVTRLTNGYVGPTRNIYHDSGVPYLLARHVKDNRLQFDGKTFITDEFNRKNKKSMLKAGDVLLVQSGHIGHSAVVTEEHVGHNCHAMIVITAVEGAFIGPFLSLFFNSSAMKQKFQEIRSGSTVPHLTCGEVKELMIPLPDLATQRRVVDHSHELDEETQRLARLYERKHAALEALKKSLLHQAFTGEL